MTITMMMMMLLVIVMLMMVVRNKWLFDSRVMFNWSRLINRVVVVVVYVTLLSPVPSYSWFISDVCSYSMQLYDCMMFRICSFAVKMNNESKQKSKKSYYTRKLQSYVHRTYVCTV